MSMIPIGSGRYVRRAKVTYAIILINVIVYVMSSYENFFITTSESWISRFALIPILVLEKSQWYRFITSMFLHADLFHILFNMYFLYIFGREVENVLGHGRYLALYLFSGLAASFFHIAYTPIVGVHMVIVPALGASGAISGVLGAYLLLFPHRRMTICWFLWLMPWCFTTIASYYLIFWFALQVIYGYARLGNIAFFAHAGGFVTGMALLGLIKPIVAREYATPPVPWYYDGGGFDGYYPITPYYIYPRRGLGATAKTILLILLLALMIGGMYSILVSTHMRGGIYLYSISVKQNGGVVSDVAVYTIDRGVVITPSIDEPRIVLNRLNWAGLLRGVPNGVYEEFTFDSMIPTMIRGLRIHLKLVGKMVYDEKGVLKYSEGKMITDVLQIMSGYRVTIIRNQEFVYVLKSSEITGDIGWRLFTPLAVISVIITVLATYTVYAKDREIVVE